MSATLPEGQPLREFSFEELVNHQRAGEIAGWIYPKRSVSGAIKLLTRSRQAALNLWGWVAILALLAGVAMPIMSGSWLWALLVALAWFLWKANRQSMEQLFLEQLVEEKAYFDKIAQTDMVRVVLKQGVKRSSAITRQHDAKPGDIEVSVSEPRSAREQEQTLEQFDERLASARARQASRDDDF